MKVGLKSVKKVQGEGFRVWEGIYEYLYIYQLGTLEINLRRRYPIHFVIQSSSSFPSKTLFTLAFKSFNIPKVYHRTNFSSSHRNSWIIRKAEKIKKLFSEPKLNPIESRVSRREDNEWRYVFKNFSFFYRHSKHNRKDIWAEKADLENISEYFPAG